VIAIVVSRADSASEHIGEALLAEASWRTTTDDSRPDALGGGDVHRHGPFELRSFDDLHLELEAAAAAFFREPELLVFASRHSGETGPLLTAHFTGNFGPAEFGGDADALATAAPGAQARLLDAFDAHAPEGYAVGMECTHHGPSDVGCPSLFVELGSGEAEWDDPAGATAVARAILDLGDALAVDGIENGVDTAVDDGDADLVDAVSPVAVRGDRTVVGFGGGHYVPRFERVVRETAWTVGHVAADWALDAMRDRHDDGRDRDGSPSQGVEGDAGEFDAHRDVLAAAFDASDAEHALVDGDHPDLEATVESLGYRVVSETWLRAVDDRDLDAVAALEDELASVDDGLRFGQHRPVGDPAGDGWAVRDLPDALVAAARATDTDATREAIAAATVAYETRNGGAQASGRAAFPVRRESGEGQDGVAAYDALVDDLVAILAPEYDEIERDSERVVGRVRSFDPGLARERGVPEGPKFGRLANGEAVAVDGERVEPASVQSQTEDVFEI
jgi:D-aminoacyl-tRNA deacylase